MGFNLGFTKNLVQDFAPKLDGMKQSLNATVKVADSKAPMENIYETSRGSLPNSASMTVSSPLTNWYKALPYGFKFTPHDKDPITIFLPISPSNLSIITHFATNVISTLYGTVEEHSEQRYFDIIIDGNTGIAPTYTDITSVENAASAKGESNGRKSFTPVETIPSGLLGGFFSKTIGAANQALNKAADVVSKQKNNSGVHPAKTGYVAFHNLYKFFLYYKKDVSGELSVQPRTSKKGHPLIFFNYKDNNQYYCSIQRFTLKKSADSPMLYNYTIQLRAYKIDKLGEKALDADDDMAKRKEALGLNGVKNSSVFSTIKGISSGAKSVFGALSGGAKIFGS